MIPDNLAEPNVINALSQSGVGWVRLTLFWGFTENKPGVFNWQHFDKAMNALAAAHINAFVTLDGPVPCWALASQSGGAACTAPQWVAPPPDLWAKFVTAAVQRYKGQVKYWELWNEPDRDITAPDSTTRLTEYRDKVLIPGAQAIRQADPNAYVVGPTFAANILGNTNSGPNLQAALSLLFTGDAGTYVDVISLHSYSPDTALGKIASARTALDAIGLRNKPVWITEDGVISPNTASDPSGEQGQAAFLKKEVQQTLVPSGADKVFWFALTDSRTSTTSEIHKDHFGLVNNQDYETYNWTPRPSYTQMQKIAQNACPQ